MKNNLTLLCMLSLCGCAYFEKNPQAIERLEKDAVDAGEVIFEAIEDEPETAAPKK